MTPGSIGSGGRAAGMYTAGFYTVKECTELPDLSAYLTALEPRVVGQPLQAVTLARPFSFGASTRREAAIGRRVKRLRLSGNGLSSSSRMTSISCCT